MNYTEYLVEYDYTILAVYLSGLDEDGFWTNIENFDEVNEPEDFANGIVAGFRLNGKFAQALSVDILGE